ncbi:MAG: hypothetical protein IKQ60_04595 [Candidatus Methanomethylophilaceae archaeon]|nr:hypothetical protein [Candidatus Methanomethylophilaceae archaeon]
MGFLDKVGEGMKEAGNKFKEGVVNVDDKLGEKIDIAKLESQIRDQERELESLKAQIGGKVVDSMESDGKFDVSSIDDLMEKVKQVKSVISVLNGQLESLKK